MNVIINTIFVITLITLQFVFYLNLSKCDQSDAVKTYSNLTHHHRHVRQLNNDDDYIENYFTLANGRIEIGKLNSLTVGKYGPQLIEDRNYLQEMNHFNRERIPERVVHAVGSGAYGYFKPLKNSPIFKYTKAKLFSSQSVPITVRFSTVIGERGTPDVVRDPRGFAIKFKTSEGDWDMVGLNFPVFFVRDSMRFMNFIHSFKKYPQNNLINMTTAWDFISLVPETLHAVCHLFSDLGTPYSYRFMDGFSINTFKLINQHGAIHYARWQFRTVQGIRNFTDSEAMMMAGKHSDWAAADLFNAIKRSNYPSWTMFVQVIPAKNLHSILHFNPLDPTKIWPIDVIPLIKVGHIVLNRNPENYFAEIEQIAFNPANLVPGMEPSPDKILQGRLFSYFDAQTYRLGANFYKIPVNRPAAPLVQPNVRDGAYCFDNNDGSQPNYWPNSFGRVDEIRESSYEYHLNSNQVKRFETMRAENDFFQVNEFYLSLSNKDRYNLITNIGSSIMFIPDTIQAQVLRQFQKVNSKFYRQLLDFLSKNKKSSY